MAGEVPITPQMLKRLGKALVDAVVAEAKKDLAKRGQVARGQPLGLPRDESFFDSFGFQVVGKSTVEITCSWPWIEQHVDGRTPYRMEWLTQEKGAYRVPMVQSDGTVIVRMAPLRTNQAWIHPGFARHTFLERGVEKGREKMAEVIAEEVIAMLASGDPTR
jgi:hypothetical protein